jgi:DNA-binding transcriptional ArsR family regulator
VLRRGKPSAAAPEQPASTSAKTTSHASTAPPAASGAIQIIPAISDAGGAEPRPYTYNLKPQEEQQLRKKMLALAAEEIRARARQLASGSVEPAPAARPSRGQTAATKTMQPIFDDVQLHAFDVSNSNEAVLVLSAKAHMPHLLKQGTPEMQYYVTLVAREDIYGELHKAFSSLTDSGHLDVLPRMELIDAVDAEGDGRGELLFRQISDAGSAFVLYRVIGDQLWPLFQGVPGQ